MSPEPQDSRASAGEWWKRRMEQKRQQRAEQQDTMSLSRAQGQHTLACSRWTEETRRRTHEADDNGEVMPMRPLILDPPFVLPSASTSDGLVDEDPHFFSRPIPPEEGPCEVDNRNVAWRYKVIHKWLSMYENRLNHPYTEKDGCATPSCTIAVSTSGKCPCLRCDDPEKDVCEYGWGRLLLEYRVLVSEHGMWYAGLEEVVRVYRRQHQNEEILPSLREQESWVDALVG